ncbi:5-methylcytosine-specific restriction endonuclease system specificity protein McrC [Sporosarcina sp. Marseille-Q4063]|uniref:5-methylcytosine-specific restriction endonuclease system specificity protein McrC n=1 Tax=Sporosarcina sp. Marseille-Q4063 TaxID=2810514 RepID=UPI001BAF6073|nr:5-methylcytosine-specific restriction endonuclease system specificity protein McrC [Sporosarcina sp. Marseille-Q4063]QUW23049.1 5-methylcytosine-specific restriction endonuclease system specificity protein McrC [Sporosarcina sp. Marseille-Q4063]
MIKIKNIYHMLTYAFRVLNKANYNKIAVEEFDHTADLLAAILIKGVNSQVKRGLGKEYIQTTAALRSPKGKINVTQSIKHQSHMKSQLICNYEVYTENTYMNQILKITMMRLLRLNEVSLKNKRELRKALLFFSNVYQIDFRTINWSTLNYTRNNSTYKMLMNICYFIIDGLLLTEKEGDYKSAKFMDDQKMHRLFEKFVYEYYRKHFPEYRVNAPHIKWQVDEGDIEFLPTMKTDIVLRSEENTLIIDTKYYGKTMQKSFNKKSFHSNNLYQIFTYVKNEDIKKSGNVSGMLLYAKTEEDITPNETFMVSGNRIGVKTIDLNMEFHEIKKQLDGFVGEFL